VNPVELSNCALWMEGPTLLAHFMETSEGEFNSAHVPEECLAERRSSQMELTDTATCPLLRLKPKIETMAGDQFRAMSVYHTFVCRLKL